jgi:hypothetical protein
MLYFFEFLLAVQQQKVTIKTSCLTVLVFGRRHAGRQDIFLRHQKRQPRWTERFHRGTGNAWLHPVIVSDHGANAIA